MTASVAGLQSLKSYVRRDHIDRYIKDGRSIQDLQEHFMFRGLEVAYTSDLSAIWDQGRFPDSELSLANTIFSWLRNTAEAGDVTQINAFLDTFARTASFAFLWKCLLESGAEQPNSIGTAIWELACATPILHGVDVRHALGAYLEHVNSKLPRDARAKIETAILQIPETARKKDDPEFLERSRNR